MVTHTGRADGAAPGTTGAHVSSTSHAHHHHPHDHGHGHDHGHSHRPHVAVVDRPVGAATMPSLVFPELVEGSYELFDKGGDAVLLEAAITGGEVTFLDWPAGGGGPV